MPKNTDANDRLEKFVIEMFYLAKDCDDPKIAEVLHSAAQILTLLLERFRAN